MTMVATERAVTAGGASAAELRAEHLTVRFQGLAAISDVSLQVERHQVFGLIGPNGAGKTTLVNCLTGFQRPTEGRVLAGRTDTAGWSPTEFRRNGIARTFQAGRLFTDMTVVENAEVTGVSLGLSRRAARVQAMELLDWIGIADKADEHASILAYTDQRRLGIARALMLSPAFILLDEPAAGMSDAECEDLMVLVASIPTTFICGVLLIEHNMRVVMGISDRIHVLDGGRTLAEGTPGEIQRHEAVMAAYLGLEA
ncbi:branched-chain amino acid ABC transporter ATP-binding protein [Skermanella stibiiresistens SB22]|uniref:Branched-chain amino acid ABC transporter ATP-binding protein n=1 Tax=Skermanella stibiiresistens SB22 TaxID=1385369 RepID=W9GZ81_9PROT|nr:ABC transporter ATP-binding protein [Skermanella stibiiresistens]EWY37762.1 branched-chain amino acid ABC transporter ATP-binding protein [Skermanella stibiiresistens SB22]